MSTSSGQLPKIAAIGAGYWGKNLIRNFHALGALDTICESNSEVLAAFTEQYPDVKPAASYQEVLENKGIEAVSLATPAETHYTMVKQALNAGKHVYVEKPLALHADEGAELVALADKKGLQLMVGHLLHYHPVVNKLKALVGDGTLGRLQYIYSNRLNLGKIRTEENILWSFAPHDISLVLALTGEMPDSITASGSYFLSKNIADVTVSCLNFPSGVAAHIFVSWLHPFKEQKLVVVGDRSMAVFDDTEPEDKLLLYPHQVMWKDGHPVPDKKDAQVVKWDKSEPLRNECAHFLDCVVSGKKPLTGGDEGLRVLKVLQACQRSMEKGGGIVGLEEIASDKKDYRLHPSAEVDPGVSIGKGTAIWHFSHLLSGTKVGKGCNIGQNVVIGPDVIVGDRCKIQNNVSVYKGVTLEDDVFCGPSMVFTNVFNPRAEIRRMDEVRPTLVKKGASIGANSTIVCGHTLGRYSFIGAGAVVTKDVPDHALMMGNPARRQGWMCSCGVKLTEKEAGKWACDDCGKLYSEGSQGLSPDQE